MKKVSLFFILTLMIIGFASISTTLNIYGNSKLVENISDFKVYLRNVMIDEENVEITNNDTFEINNLNGNITYEIVNDSTEYDAEVYLECNGTKDEEKEWNFDYTGSEQTFNVQKTGTYKLETWGAQGGSASSTYIGGYGGYSVGEINLENKDNLYINVGGAGIYENGGYNGGGELRAGQYSYGGSGGGATHVASTSGLLETLEDEKSSIYIVSGGGGGGNYRSQGYGDGNGGSGGGYIGGTGQTVNFTNGYGHGYGTGGTQVEGGSAIWISDTVSSDYTWFLNGIFGSAGKKISNGGPQSGGGGGFYGGGSGDHGGGGGGSGYIGNSLLTEKSMYCYNCSESNEKSTKTISTTCVNETPTENCSKSGNGYVRITLLEVIEEFSTNKEIIEAQDYISANLENVDYENLTCKLKISKISRTEKKEPYSGPTSWEYDYTGGEQEFIVPKSGTYKLETWGAQGGSYSETYYGGYGGYSVGTMNLTKNETIYINVGGSGNGSGKHISQEGGYNGGGSATADSDVHTCQSSGGGATHIAIISGLLSTLYNNIEDILIASGGGGGSAANTVVMAVKGGSGGGIVGNSGEKYTEGNWYSIGYGGSQTTGGTNYDTHGTSGQYSGNGSFGIGASALSSGGGGGFYGGGVSTYSAGGGSGYIGNSLLTNKSMYCYNCTESNEESTKTISTTCVNETPTSNCSKIGNGYARITLIK